MIASDALKQGETYTVYCNDELIGEFTASETISTVGSSIGMGGMGGGNFGGGTKPDMQNGATMPNGEMPTDGTRPEKPSDDGTAPIAPDSISGATEENT